MIDIQRELILHGFLKICGINSYKLIPLKSDASLRKYYKVITSNNSSFIIMDSAQDHKSVYQFVRIATLLLKYNFSAPHIYEVDYDNGLILLEDFGDKSIKQILSKDNINEIYKLIISLLCKIQETINHESFPYKDWCLHKELGVVKWYLQHLHGEKIGDELSKEYLEIWKNILNKLPKINHNVMIHKDFHVENLMYLKDRNCINKIGILDFQDAVIGSPMYDLTHLINDARFEINEEMKNFILSEYIKNSHINISKEDLNLHCAILGAQLNSRVLGIFARYFLIHKNDHYLKLIPRVKKYLMQNISHKYLNDKLSKWINSFV